MNGRDIEKAPFYSNTLKLIYDILVNDAKSLSMVNQFKQ